MARPTPYHISIKVLWMLRRTTLHVVCMSGYEYLFCSSYLQILSIAVGNIIHNDGKAYPDSEAECVHMYMLVCTQFVLQLLKVV